MSELTKKQRKLEGLANRLIRSSNHKSRRINKAIRKTNGLTPEELAYFHQSREWKILRYQVLRTYGRKCMCCGVTGGTFHVDHIVPISIKPSGRLDFNNLQVLCSECNEGKSNYYSDDFREKVMNEEFSPENCLLEILTGN